MKEDLDKITPKEIVSELDKYIIGQDKAKKVIAVALRNRHRRKLLSEEMREEVSPKNIILIGSTGVGKTEIARRISKLFNAPFIKVEATKYTEVGYVGRDVESMVRDLVSHAINMVRQEETVKNGDNLDLIVNRKIADIIMKDRDKDPYFSGASSDSIAEDVKKGVYDEYRIELEMENKPPQIEFDLINLGDMSELSSMLDNMKNMVGNKPKQGSQKTISKVSVHEAKKILKDREAENAIDENKVREIALERVQSSGIIFIDEIDKIAGKNSSSQVDVSREGVQRDILPIVEGTKVNTKFGVVDTTHILFIAAGAFHVSKPSDLIPELQGRFPLRVELESLTANDFYRILTEPENALIKQYKALMKTENVELDFHDDAIREISEIAQEVNSSLENIGARRLHTILENLLEDISFNAPDLSGQKVEITRDYVKEKLRDTVRNQDLSGYIL